MVYFDNKGTYCMDILLRNLLKFFLTMQTMRNEKLKDKQQLPQMVNKVTSSLCEWRLNFHLFTVPHKLKCYFSARIFRMNDRKPKS